jgi:hypothetical protein
MDKNTRKNNRSNRRAHTYKKILKVYEPLSAHNVNKELYDKKYPLTYGEVTNEGATELAKIFTNIKSIKTYPVGQRTFYDLGSGIGRFVFLITNLIPSLTSKGIELAKERHDTAMIAYNNLNDVSLQKRVEFINCSLFDKPLNDAAWIFISNLCFSDELNESLFKKFEVELRPHTIIIFMKHLNLPTDKFDNLGTKIVPMSWKEESTVYIYRKK